MITVTGVKLISSDAWKPLWPLSEAVFCFRGARLAPDLIDGSPAQLIMAGSTDGGRTGV
jgi:hypothetical protein